MTVILTKLVATLPVPSASWQSATSPEKRAIQDIINKINSKPNVYNNSKSIEKTKDFFRELLTILKKDEKDNINLTYVCERLVSYLDDRLVRSAIAHQKIDDHKSGSMTMN